MAHYFDADGKEIFDSFDIKNGIFINAHDQWLSFWQPITNKGFSYDNAFKVFESKVELKAYTTTQHVTPYKIIDGYSWVSSEDGWKTTIVESDTGKTVISRVWSDDEYIKILRKRQRQKRKAFVDKAMANVWTHWATLTFSPEVANGASYTYLEAKVAFMQWRKAIARKLGYDFKYMAIAEYGGEYGRIHWHALLYFDPQLVFKQARSPSGKMLFLTNSNHRNVLDSNGKSIPKLELPAWKYGLTDFYPTYGSKLKAVNYIAKYMTKGENGAPYEQQGLRAKSYLSSKGLKMPDKEYLLDGEKSKMISEANQTSLEKAPPIFKLIKDGVEIMHKSEAIIDDCGATHVLKRDIGIIDIKKEHHQPTTNHTDDPR